MRTSPGSTAFLFAILSPALVLAQELGPEQPPAKGRTLLFVDDHDILYRSGTKRVLQPLKRHAAKPLLEMAKPWEVAIGYTSVHRDPKSGKYQLWYHRGLAELPAGRYSLRLHLERATVFAVSFK